MRPGHLALLVALAGMVPAGAAVSKGAAQKEHVITASGAAFSPKELVVKQGETVVWKNDDVVVHNIKAEDKSFTSGELSPDQSFKWVAKKKGKHAYFCSLHTTMKGTLTVR